MRPRRLRLASLFSLETFLSPGARIAVPAVRGLPAPMPRSLPSVYAGRVSGAWSLRLSADGHREDRRGRDEKRKRETGGDGWAWFPRLDDPPGCPTPGARRAREVLGSTEVRTRVWSHGRSTRRLREAGGVGRAWEARGTCRVPSRQAKTKKKKREKALGKNRRK